MQRTLSSDLSGWLIREALPGIEDSWISTYGEVALTGKPIRFENLLELVEEAVRSARG